MEFGMKFVRDVQEVGAFTRGCALIGAVVVFLFVKKVRKMNVQLNV
jgi:hypothetical protein